MKCSSVWPYTVNWLKINKNFSNSNCKSNKRWKIKGKRNKRAASKTNYKRSLSLSLRFVHRSKKLLWSGMRRNNSSRNWLNLNNQSPRALSSTLKTEESSHKWLKAREASQAKEFLRIIWVIIAESHCSKQWDHHLRPLSTELSNCKRWLKWKICSSLVLKANVALLP